MSLTDRKQLRMAGIIVFAGMGGIGKVNHFLRQAQDRY